MLFKNCVTYNKSIINIHMLFENSVSYNKCNHTIHMLFNILTLTKYPRIPFIQMF